MFDVGEIVFCPLRGSGVVEAIEMRTMLNETKEYFIIQMKNPSITMMIPSDRMGKSDFRKISEIESWHEVEKLLAQKEVEVSHAQDIKMRTKKNQEKLATGGFLGCSEVVRDLACMEAIKPLNSVERSLLVQAKKLLADEVALIKEISTEEAHTIIDKILAI